MAKNISVLGCRKNPGQYIYKLFFSRAQTSLSVCTDQVENFEYTAPNICTSLRFQLTLILRHVKSNSKLRQSNRTNFFAEMRFAEIKFFREKKDLHSAAI